MKKVFSVVAGTILLGSVHAVHAQDVLCQICWFEPHGQNATASICEAKMVSEKRLHAFMYHVGEQVGQKGINEWSFECATAEKRVKGYFVIEGPKNEGN